MIGLYNLEPKYTNIALEKVRTYYERQGIEVNDYVPIEANRYDKIFCSSIFTWSNKSYVKDDMICGGTGFDITTKLPSEIEKMKPKINLGFTTRGCIRKCPFCVVPKKEGWIKVVGDIYDFWDGKASEITILDNNILAVSRHFRKIADQIKRENLKVDFNQGLDCRLVTDNIAKILKSLRYKYYRFSFDTLNVEKYVRRTIDILNQHEIYWSIWYVLVGFNTTYQEDLYRIELLKSLNQRVYVQRYNNQTNDFYNKLYGWANNRKWFIGITFKQFLKMKNRNYEKIIEI